MDVEYTQSIFDGLDRSKNFLPDEGDSSEEIRYIADSWKGRWISAFTSRYKLVISQDDVPWLFDLERDPDELYNFYKELEHSDIVAKMKSSLYEAMVKYSFSSMGETLIWDWPACVDSRDNLEPYWKGRVCSDLSLPQFQSGCLWDEIKSKCPFVCGACCQNSEGQIWVDYEFRSCADVSNYCSNSAVQQFCPLSCGLCGSKP